MCKDKTPVDGKDVIYQDEKPLPAQHATNNLDFPKEFEKYLKFVRTKMYGKDVRESIARLAQITYKYTEVINNTNKENIDRLKNNLIKEFTDELNKLNKIFEELKSNFLTTLKDQNKEDFEKFKTEISKINANAEVVDARSGQSTLKEYLDIISLLDAGKLHNIFPNLENLKDIKKPNLSFEKTKSTGSLDLPDSKYTGMVVNQKDNFLSLFSCVLSRTEIKNNFKEDISRFLRVYIGSSSFLDDKKENTYMQVQTTPVYRLLKSNVIVGGNNPFSNPIYIPLPYSQISFIRFELEDGSQHTRRISCIDEDIKKSHHSLIYWKAIYDNNLNAGWGGAYQNYAPRWGCVKFCIDGVRLKLWFTSGDVQVHIRYIEISYGTPSTYMALEKPYAGV